MIDFKKQFQELKANQPVLWQLVRQHLILRYRRTILGYLWTLLNPLLMMTVTAVVFATLFKSDLKTYAVFLFSGMLPWNFFSASIIQSGGAFLNSEGLIKKIYLPKTLFPLSVTLGALIDSALSFVSLFVIIAVIGGPISPALFFIPVAYALFFVFALGFAMMISVATVFFRDLQYIITIAMQAWFFLTPVMYNADALSGKIAHLIRLNPVLPFIELFRSPLYLAQVPPNHIILQAVLLAFVSLFLGCGFFMAQEDKIIFRL